MKIVKVFPAPRVPINFVSSQSPLSGPGVAGPYFSETPVGQSWCHPCVLSKAKQKNLSRVSLELTTCILLVILISITLLHTPQN